MMQKIIISLLLSIAFVSVSAQEVMTPKMLLELNKVSAKGISKDGENVIYSTSKYNVATDSKVTTVYKIPVEGGTPVAIETYKNLLPNKHISPNGTYEIFTEDVKLKNITGKDFYPEIKNSNVQIYDELNYRHWDTWEDGAYSHVFFKSTSEDSEAIDLMPNEPFDCPQKPFGGSEDYLWSPDSENILYVTKKLSGTAYAISTNTDIYSYNLASKITTNLTEDNKGYDTNPAFSSKNQLAWLQMKRDGYEADKNDIIILIDGEKI